MAGASLISPSTGSTGTAKLSHLPQFPRYRPSGRRWLSSCNWSTSNVDGHCDGYNVADPRSQPVADCSLSGKSQVIGNRADVASSRKQSLWESCRMSRGLMHCIPAGKWVASRPNISGAPQQPSNGSLKRRHTTASDCWCSGGPCLASRFYVSA
jgi:hypothetical protein